MKKDDEKCLVEKFSRPYPVRPRTVPCTVVGGSFGRTDLESVCISQSQRPRGFADGLQIRPTYFSVRGLLGLIFAFVLIAGIAHAQDTAKVIIETKTEPVKQPRIYTVSVETNSIIKREHSTHEARLTIETIQGTEGPFLIELIGPATVEKVDGDQVKSWAVREEGGATFLELAVNPDVKKINPAVVFKSEKYRLPTNSEIPHLGRGRAASFANTIRLAYDDGTAGKLVESAGFLPLTSEAKNTFHTVTGGVLKLSLTLANTTPPPVSLRDLSLTGTMGKASQSIAFQLSGEAVVTEPDVTFAFLRGGASITKLPTGTHYTVYLNQKGNSHFYELKFPKAGTFPINIEFAAKVGTGPGLLNTINFVVESQGVMPISIAKLEKDIDFAKSELQFEGGAWKGFLPASGAVNLSWKPAADSGEGKLFFSTNGTIETRIGTGLARQTHDIAYRVLQGELKELKLKIVGEGEVVSVSGNNILSWKVEEDFLNIHLNEPIKREATISVKTQLPIGSLPSVMSPLRLEPVGSIRHAGFIRMANQGSVRLEPSDLVGLSQLSPDKYPRDPISARQAFVYRFPSANYRFQVTCDRIQPEVHVSEVSRYALTESDRTLTSAIELDIREAPIREWDIEIPADYSVVSVTGAEIADYILSTETSKLKVVFSSDVSGRKLIQLILENNITAKSEDWALPKLSFPDAKSTRGDIGLSAAPGYRLTVGATENLTERPVSTFPGDGQNLQHYFRIRESDWTGNVAIEVLEKSIQADVFHLYSLSEGTAYGSVLINYFITGAPSSEFDVSIPEGVENVVAEGKDLRSQKLEGNTLKVWLHQAVMGSFTLLVTFEEAAAQGLIPGRVFPDNVQGENGYVQIVSPRQVDMSVTSASDALLELDQLELPPEFRLLSASPSLGIWQYNARPFDLQLGVKWLDPERTIDQVVEFAEASTLISRESETVTDLIYYVKSRDNQPLSLILPPGAKIWDVRTNGRNVASRTSGEATQIPLPATGRNGNLTEVRMRLGNTIHKGRIHLPAVGAPVLKTEWHVKGDQTEITTLKGKYSVASAPVLPPNGFKWVGSHGLPWLVAILGCVILGVVLRRQSKWVKHLAYIPLVLAVVLAILTGLEAYREKSKPSPLKISLPVLAAGETVEVVTNSTPVNQVSLSKTGLFAGVLGVGLIVASFVALPRRRLLTSGMVLIGIGALLFMNGGYLFFGYLATAIALFFIIPDLAKLMKPTVVLLLLSAGLAGASPAADYKTFDSIGEKWSITHLDSRLFSSVTVALSGKGGDEFLLLKSPAILTAFESEKLLLRKEKCGDGTLNYTVVLPLDDPFAVDLESDYQVTFSYQMDLGDVRKEFAIPTGVAAIHRIDATYDETGWEFVAPTAVKISQENSRAGILLMPAPVHQITLRPKERDPARERSEFFVESQQLFTPSPGVVDGTHRFEIRSAQGVVKTLKFRIPAGFTVSEVAGPVASWQFDPEAKLLHTVLEPAQAGNFSLSIETQSGLPSFPTETTIVPLLVEEAEGQTGVIGLAFRGDAQPEGAAAGQGLSPVNLDDFDSALITEPATVLHRAYRYKETGGDLVVKINEVSPEIRVTSKQVMSLGDENLLYNINFLADISRAGIFQLNFSIPENFEVNSISGQALHHWADHVADGERTITLHLAGKTLGRQEFAVSLIAPPPARDAAWQLPGFSITEANRQSGELIIQPATGIRLSTVERQNVSELDPRTLGAKQKGAMAFRLLQKDWTVSLNIETLAPRVTGEILHDITVRDTQVRTSISASFEIENAAIRKLQIRLPINDDDTGKTLRANGSAVSGISKVEGETDLWEIQLKRWLTGPLDLQLEWEKRIPAEEGLFSQSPVTFLSVKQTDYYMAVRPTGRLEVELPEGAGDWRRVDWKTLPKSLRESNNRIAPALSLKSRSNPLDLVLNVTRHSLADALKLRITRSEFKTVLSPYGTRLTSADLEVEVIQRSHLTMTLPPASELFCLFVNRETVEPVKVDENRWQFPVLPDTNGRRASVLAIYLEPGDSAMSAKMVAPMLSVPMENIVWEVLSPDQLRMASHSGNLDLIDHEQVENQDRSEYLEQARKRRDDQSAQAISLLEKANELLRDGKQTLARQALSSVANRSGLDAASNEDARIQLETLQTQQALVGLNTRRQRMYLDRNAEEAIGSGSEQLRESASRNPVIQMGDLNFRPGDLSQLLQGNSNDELMALRKIASRIVAQQQSEEVTYPGLDISPPYEGNRYRFTRRVQVSEGAPLNLDLKFARISMSGFWRGFGVVLMLLVFAGLMAFQGTPASKS